MLYIKYSLGGGVVLDQLAVLHAESSPDTVDLLVDLCSVMVTLLSSPGGRKINITLYS